MSPDVGSVAGSARIAHGRSGNKVVGAPSPKLLLDDLKGAVSPPGVTQVGQHRVSEAEFQHARRNADPPGTQAQPVAQPLDHGLAGTSDALVGHAEPSRPRFDARLDAVAVALAVHHEVGFEGEADFRPFEQLGKSPRRKRERLQRKAAHRRRPPKRVLKRPARADRGQRADGFRGTPEDALNSLERKVATYLDQQERLFF